MSLQDLSDFTTDPSTVSTASSISGYSPSFIPHKTSQDIPDSLFLEMPEFGANTTGKHALPMSHERSAPKKFKGKYYQIRDFLEHYNRLCAAKQVTGKDKIQSITQYCKRKEQDFIKSLPSYDQDDWDDFEKDLLLYYDAAKRLLFCQIITLL